MAEEAVRSGPRERPKKTLVAELCESLPQTGSWRSETEDGGVLQPLKARVRERHGQTVRDLSRWPSSVLKR